MIELYTKCWVFKKYFQLIKDDFYNNILGKIEYYFSSFHSVFDKEDGIYPILGELGSLYNLEFNWKKWDIQKKL